MSNAIFESSRAANYDEFVSNWIPNYHYFIQLTPALLRSAATRSLLVVGCGTGNEIEAVVKAQPGWKVTGVDPSPEMVSQAREKLKAYPDVNLVDGVVGQLPTDQPLYGAATLLLVLHFLADDGAKLELLQDVARRLAPGAPLVMLDITGSRQQIADNLQVLKHLVPPGISDDEIAERLNRIEHELHYVSEQRFTELLEAAGFEAPLRFFQTAIYMGWLARKRPATL